MLRIDNVKFTCTGASYDVAGKDTVIFVDKADHQKPNDVKFEVEEEEEPGGAFSTAHAVRVRLLILSVGLCDWV